VEILCAFRGYELRGVGSVTAASQALSDAGAVVQGATRCSRLAQQQQRTSRAPGTAASSERKQACAARRVLELC
jgi:hypothetical protein